MTLESFRRTQCGSMFDKTVLCFRDFVVGDGPCVKTVVEDRRIAFQHTTGKGDTTMVIGVCIRYFAL